MSKEEATSIRLCTWGVGFQGLIYLRIIINNNLHHSPRPLPQHLKKKKCLQSIFLELLTQLSQVNGGRKRGVMLNEQK